MRYYFAPNLPLTILPLLRERAAKLSISLVEGLDAEEGSDLHFFAPDSTYKGRTGLRVALGPGWTADLVKSRGLHGWIEAETASVVDLLLRWALERQECHEVRPLRHELGNLVVILLARISKLRGQADAENMERLENLHQRLNDLYRKFEAIKIP